MPSNVNNPQPDTHFEIVIGGKSFSNLTDFKFSESLDDIVKTFSFSLGGNNTIPEDFEFQNELVSIIVEEDGLRFKLLEGYIDTISTATSNSGTTTSFTGRSRLGVWLDSSYNKSVQIKDTNVLDLIKSISTGDVLAKPTLITQLKNTKVKKFEISSGETHSSILSRISNFQDPVILHEYQDGKLAIHEFGVANPDATNREVQAETFDTNIDFSQLSSEIIVRGQGSSTGKKNNKIQTKVIIDSYNKSKIITVHQVKNITQTSCDKLANKVAYQEIESAFTGTITCRPTYVVLGDKIVIPKEFKINKYLGSLVKAQSISYSQSPDSGVVMTIGVVPNETEINQTITQS